MNNQPTDSETLWHFNQYDEASLALEKFLHPECQARRFHYDSPCEYPLDSCLCWHEYETIPGLIKASFRHLLLSAAMGLPFSNVKRRAFQAFGARIHPHSYLAPQAFIDPLFPSLLIIEEGVLIGLGARIALHEQSGRRFSAGRVIIRRGATIGADARIRCGIEIGAFAEIGVSAVVIRDVPAHARVIGNPARILPRS